MHDDVIKRNQFPRSRPFVWTIHRSKIYHILGEIYKVLHFPLLGLCQYPCLVGLLTSGSKTCGHITESNYPQTTSNILDVILKKNRWKSSAMHFKCFMLLRSYALVSVKSILMKFIRLRGSNILVHGIFMIGQAAPCWDQISKIIWVANLLQKLF